jgi:ribosomal protein L11 methyltransferase
MTDWIEVTVDVDGEGAEAISEALRRYVHQGVAMAQAPDGRVAVCGYFPADSRAGEARRRIEETLYFLGRLHPIPEPTFRTVHEEDWAEAWKAHFHPIQVGERLLIKPSWAEVAADPDRIVIELDPGMAFGTGLHPSTQLCLRACEWFVGKGYKVLDLGTGSGILAIAAAKLGAGRVIARDIDEAAVGVAQENVERNGVGDKVIVQLGSLEGLTTSARHFDITLVNILAKTIIDLLDQGLRFTLWPGGRLVAAGIIEEQAAEVAAAMERNKLHVQGQESMGEWVMIIAQRHWE